MNRRRALLMAAVWLVLAIGAVSTADVGLWVQFVAVSVVAAGFAAVARVDHRAGRRPFDRIRAADVADDLAGERSHR